MYQKVTSDLEAECDEDSPVYLARVAKDGSTRVCEAFPVYTGEGTACTGYLPDDVEEGSAIYMVFHEDGRWKWAGKN